MKRFIVHPFLFALFPVLSLLSTNLREVKIQVIFLPSIVILLTTSLIWLVLGRALNDWGKAALLSSLSIFLFFSYGHIFKLASSVSIISSALDRQQYLLPIFGVAVILGAASIIARSRKNLTSLNSILNVMSMALVLINVFNIGYFELTEILSARHVREESQKEFKPAALDQNTAEPDIYYLVFDRYSSSSSRTC